MGKTQTTTNGALKTEFYLGRATTPITPYLDEIPIQHWCWYVVHSLLGCIWIEKDSQFIAWASSIDEARDTIDGL